MPKTIDVEKEFFDFYEVISKSLRHPSELTDLFLKMETLVELRSIKTLLMHMYFQGNAEDAEKVYGNVESDLREELCNFVSSFQDAFRAKKTIFDMRDLETMTGDFSRTTRKKY